MSLAAFGAESVMPSVLQPLALCGFFRLIPVALCCSLLNKTIRRVTPWTHAIVERPCAPVSAAEGEFSR
jgi:hypothetical protein